MRILLTAFFACVLAQAQIPAQDARNVNPPNTDTHFTPKSYKTLAEWQAHKEMLRKQILSAAGLMPLFPKNDLHPRIYGRIENRDYSIEKVLLETLPSILKVPPSSVTAPVPTALALVTWTVPPEITVPPL